MQRGDCNDQCTPCVTFSPRPSIVLDVNVITYVISWKQHFFFKIKKNHKAFLLFLQNWNNVWLFAF